MNLCSIASEMRPTWNYKDQCLHKAQAWLLANAQLFMSVLNGSKLAFVVLTHTIQPCGLQSAWYELAQHVACVLRH